MRCLENTYKNDWNLRFFYLFSHVFAGILQYAKLAISLRVPGGGKKKVAAAPQGGASGAQTANEEEDEYEGGLC